MNKKANMKIINVTIFRSFNYGAMLQAYALNKKLIDLGNDCLILNFRPKDLEKRFERVYQKSKHFKEFIYNLIPLLKYRESKKKIINANLFFDKYLRLTKEYETYEDIMKDLPVADVFFCGSDQIWNPKIHGMSPLYFLDFVNSKKSVKASYAASIGENYIDKEYESKMNDYLSSFDFISVREENAKEILAFTEKEIEVIADPVFLLNNTEWQSIKKPSNIKEKYVLCYFVTQPKFLNGILKTIKDKTGFKIVSVTPYPYVEIKYDKLIRDVGPDGFLGLIADAEMVITSSFHGTALSILMEKQFYTVIGETRGSRIKNVLKKTGLEDRELNEYITNIDIDEKIDFIIVRDKVDTIRKESLKFLEKVIKVAKQRRSDNNIF